jgi:peptidoglycan-N-acetylglucosamine deacetylase
MPMRGAEQSWAGLASALLALALIAPAACAQPCDPSARPPAIELRPGQNVGLLTEGFETLPLKDHEVVLTFDDGPDPYTTPQVLDLLRRKCVVATFFPMGERAEKNPGLVKRALAEGHAVGGHTWSHPTLTDLSIAAAAEEILHGFAPLKSAGAPMQLFRFPQLGSSPQLLDWLKRRGVSAVSADIDPWDWAGDPPAQTLQRLREALAEKGRGIILLHDNQPNTAKLLPELLDFLDREGYRVVPLRAAPIKPAG